MGGYITPPCVRTGAPDLDPGHTSGGEVWNRVAPGHTKGWLRSGGSGPGCPRHTLGGLSLRLGRHTLGGGKRLRGDSSVCPALRAVSVCPALCAACGTTTVFSTATLTNRAASAA